MVGNVIVGQSGGPTAVINSSLAGVYKTAIDRGAPKVYGMLFGIQGFLDEQYKMCIRDSLRPNRCGKDGAFQGAGGGHVRH